MRRTLIMALLLFSFSFCGKVDDLFLGNAFADFNGQSWEPGARAYTNTTDGNTFDLILRSSINRYEEQEFIVTRIPKTKGRYQLFEHTYANATANKTIGSFYVVEGGDVLCDTYDVNDQDSLFNYIIVDDISNLGQVSGSFSANLYIDLPKCKASAVDSIILRNGTFKTRITN